MQHPTAHCFRLPTIRLLIEHFNTIWMLSAQALQDTQGSVTAAVVHKQEIDLSVSREEFGELPGSQSSFFVIAGDDHDAPRRRTWGLGAFPDAFIHSEANKASCLLCQLPMGEHSRHGKQRSMQAPAP
jgi:hypothetical protein